VSSPRYSCDNILQVNSEIVVCVCKRVYSGTATTGGVTKETTFGSQVGSPAAEETGKVEGEGERRMEGGERGCGRGGRGRGHREKGCAIGVQV